MASAATASPTRQTGRVPGLVNNPWEQASLQIKYPKLSEDLDTEVLIVGAGTVGLTTAYNLARAGKQVVVLEARVRAAGRGGRTTAEMSAWHQSTYAELERLYGGATASLVADSQGAAVDFVDQLVQREGIKCGWARQPGYLLPDRTGSAAAAEAQLEPELAAARRAGLDARQVDLGGAAGLGGAGAALELPGGGGLDPVAYLDGLADAAVRAGARIFEDTRVRKHSDDGALTMDGRSVRAREAVVVATGAPVTSNLVDSALHVLALHAKQVARRRYVVALRLPRGSAKAAVFWDLAEPQHNGRIVPGGSHDLLLVSGEEHDQGKKPNQYEDQYAKLEAWARARWTNAGERVGAWGFTVFRPHEKLGLYGKDPLKPRGKTWVATGDDARILTGGTIGANIISDGILGQRNAFSELYNPKRKLRGLPLLPAWSPTYFANTLRSAADLLNPFMSGPDIEDLAPGQGATINHHLRKVAIYKDEQGKKHAYSALCPHLGCVLQWNPLDSEWNCPCHGSCFSKDGCNLMGPATIHMKKLDHLSDP